METIDSGTHSRRGFLTVGIAGAALAGLSPTLLSSQVHAETKETEKANEELVLKVCREIDPKDPTKLSDALADDFVFQLTDGQPLIQGKEAFTQFIKTFMAAYERAEFIVHRSHVIGNLVINERTDNFFAKEGGQNQSFHVSGFCLVKDGKIKEWKDYQLPD